MSHDYAITFACFDSVNYTKTCLESMVKVGVPLERVVVVDNGSTDETRDYLLTLPLGGRIYNKENQACGVAWNQGILQFQAEWTVVMNNDLVVSPQWIENLIQTAGKMHNVCPTSDAKCGVRLYSPLGVSRNWLLQGESKIAGFRRHHLLP